MHTNHLTRLDIALFRAAAGVALLAIVSGCGTSEVSPKEDEYFTSGNPEADQRASRIMAREEQFESLANNPGAAPAVEAEKQPLFVRLGGEEGIREIIDDFLPRVLNDPRVNWQRKGITDGGLFVRDKSVEWRATPENVERLKLHLVQFISLASGGPAEYGGEDMKSVHADLHITNTEFDGAVGDLKASLDRLQVADREQKELLAIIESTRPQVVTKR